MFRKILIALSIIVLFGFTIASITKLNVNRFIDFSKKNPPTLDEGFKKESRKPLKRGKDISRNFSKQVLLDIPYGPNEEDLGFRKITQDDLEHVTAPGAMMVGRNGDIYIADPVNTAIKVYSGRGKYLKKIPVPKNWPGWTGDFGFDARGTLYILEPTRVYKKGPGQDSFEPVGPELNEADQLEVEPNGNLIIIDDASGRICGRENSIVRESC
ncbi:MAG: hypothetical protein IBX64_06785 [Actinobacteria bacterium]|nr:hypothetical protein [Actinomycetota bacterium]